jgi:hypothetical protein
MEEGRWPDTLREPPETHPLDDQFAIVNQRFHFDYIVAFAPSLTDVQNGSVHPIEAVFDHPLGRFGAARPRSIVALAVIRGPFLSVTGTECLPVRDRPVRNAGLVACVTPGTLLKTGGSQDYSFGQHWLDVLLPSGAYGWAPAEFLDGS